MHCLQKQRVKIVNSNKKSRLFVNVIFCNLNKCKVVNLKSELVLNCEKYELTLIYVCS